MDPRIYAPLRELERTHWWFRGRRRILAAALDRLGVRADRILDVGCGAGSNLELLGRREPGAALVGMDVEREPLRFCREDRRTSVCQADASRLPFASACFDLVAALDALEHFEDDALALRELHRVCRPGGTLLATVPACPALWGSVDELGHHHRRYRRRELLARVRAAGCPSCAWPASPREPNPARVFHRCAWDDSFVTLASALRHLTSLRLGRGAVGGVGPDTFDHAGLPLAYRSA